MKTSHSFTSRPRAGLCLAGLLCAVVAGTGCVASTRNRTPEPVPPTPAEQEMLRRLEQLEVSLKQLDDQVRRANAELGAQIGDVKDQLQTVSSKVTSQERLLNRAATAMGAFGRGVPVAGSPLPGIPGLPGAGAPGGGAEPGATGPQLGPSPAVLESTGPAGSAEAGEAYPGAPGTPPAAGQKTLERDLGEPPGVEALPEADEPRVGGSREPSSEGLRRYETAYRDLQRENYQLALMNFRSFLAEYPDTRLSDNAQYWIGEIYYAQGQFNQAVEEFRRVIDDYPGQDKEPAAYYKIALSFINLRDTVTARRYLISLLERYPEAPEARLAEEKLAEL